MSGGDVVDKAVMVGWGDLFGFEPDFQDKLYTLLTKTRQTIADENNVAPHAIAGNIALIGVGLDFLDFFAKFSNFRWQKSDQRQPKR